jgi:hypothetical protein
MHAETPEYENFLRLLHMGVSNPAHSLGVCNSVCQIVGCISLRDTNSPFDSAPCRRFDRRMNDTPAEIRLPKLWLQSEAAALLRRSRAHVQRLRLERKLGYFRGRPVTIDEKDLEIYVASAKVRRISRAVKLKTGPKKRAKGESETFEYVSAGAASRPFTLLTIAEAAIKFERTLRQIRYLCLQGRVPYILGRPPLIDEMDLAEYFECRRLAALAKIPPAPGTPEFQAQQERKMRERMNFKLRKIAVRREVKRILAERSARVTAGTFKLGAPKKQK